MAAALRDAEAAVAEAPCWPKAYYRHGSVLLKSKEYSAAYEVSVKGARLDPNNEDLAQLCQKAREAMTLHEEDGGSGSGGGDAPRESGAADVAHDRSSAAAREAQVDATAQETVRQQEAQAPRHASSDVPPSCANATGAASSAATPVPSPALTATASAGPRSAADVSDPPPSTTPSDDAPPIPTYHLELTDKDDPTKGHTLSVHLPEVKTSNQVDLSVSSTAVEIEAPPRYAKLVVALPAGANDKKAAARWKKGVLRVQLPQK